MQSVTHTSSETAKSGLATETWKLWNRNYQTPTLVNDQTISFFNEGFPIREAFILQTWYTLEGFTMGRGDLYASKFNLGKCWVEPEQPG